MDRKSKGMRGPSIFNEVAQREWTCSKNGLRKELIDFTFNSMTKATEISKCLVNISDVKNLEDRETNYLNNEGEFWIQLGTAVTPTDYYTEIFLQQMFTGERSRCYIQTKSGVQIEFTVKMLKIEFINYLYKLTVVEVYQLALQYKQNGVTMFKKYPKFAQEYFCRAAKCLISYQPFDVLTESSEHVNPRDLQSLFENLQTNIAACLVKEGRYEDVLHVTEFVEQNNEQVSDKAIYRRALALCNLNKYEEAKELIEKSNYAENKEFCGLYDRIKNEWRRSDERYTNMVKKMFG